MREKKREIKKEKKKKPTTHLVQRSRLELQDALSSSGSLSTGLLNEEGHRVALVQEAKLAAGAVDSSGVAEEASIEKRAVYISNHASNVPKGLGLSFPVLSLAILNKLLGGFVPRTRVPFVDGVDASRGWHTNIAVSQNELTKTGVQGEGVHAKSSGDAHDRRGSIQSVSRREQLRARAKEVLNGGLTARLGLLAVDTKDRTDRNVCVNVGRTIEGVEDDSVSSSHSTHHNRVLVFFTSHDVNLVGEGEAVDKDIIGKDIQLLLNIAGRVGIVARHSIQVSNTSLVHSTRYNLGSELDALQEHRKVSTSTTEALALLQEETRERDGVVGVFG